MEDNNKISGLNFTRIKNRSIDELIGICKGILFDGSVSTGEAEHLLNWLHVNPLIASDWFGRDLYQKLIGFLEDDDINSDEESELLKILIDITGRSEITASGHNAATTLPLCPYPPTEITIDNISFVLTGNFAYGRRKDLEDVIKQKGGRIMKTPSRNTRYLVIGEIGSGSWMHSTFGRKIEFAVKARDAGYMISIITEEHFLKCTGI